MGISKFVVFWIEMNIDAINSRDRNNEKEAGFRNTRIKMYLR